MFGLIHVIFKGFVVDTFGIDAWKEIMKRAGIADDSTILEMKQYDDSLTMTAVKIGSEVAGAPLDSALELFGAYFVEFAAGNGFAPLLKSLGTNLYELLSNLNILHHNVERDFASAVFPLFEVKKGASDDNFVMYYATGRPGLHPLLKGALVKATSVLFHSDLDIKELDPEEAAFLKTSEAEICLAWELTVRKRSSLSGNANKKPSTVRRKSFIDAAHGHRAALPKPVRDEPKLKEQTFGFFDFHSALTSFFACNCKCDKDEDQLNLVMNPIAETAVRPAGEPAWLGRVTADLSKQKHHILSICASYTIQEVGKHPYFVLNAQDRVKAGAALFRGINASSIASPWTDEADLEAATEFWGAYDKLDSYYDWSKSWYKQGGEKEGKIRFLSQSWGVPKDWDKIMGPDNSYAQAKAAEICCVAKEIAARELGSADNWTQVGFWLDKCCIPQGDATIMSWCVNLLEEFITFSDGLIVLLPWTYFSRLWCVYEWVCFLLVHDPMDIEICADPFIRDTTVHLYIDCIRNFKIANCQCFHEPDRQILLDKVAWYYKSPAAFEKFLKFSAIALFARCVASRRSAKAASALQPWQDLATDCGFTGLASKIEEMAKLLPIWRQAAVKFAKGGGTANLQLATNEKVDSHFRKELVPLINAQRDEAAAIEGLAHIQALKNAGKQN
eukprot:TRINITY_DN4530_c0_g1_i1.p1 TRINITY_DN4530_c0_g1~~TRINITY_DN4530_c0_g1_i1.p1  ORF type:complete len:673 (-),score=137.02 TRINITY_DN4530_c0_g1_i1:232-2250(-)